MILNIDIRDVENADELNKFGVVIGKWTIRNFTRDDEPSAFDVADSILKLLDSEHTLEVQVFHSDGRAINSECPSCGTFVCQRA